MSIPTYALRYGGIWDVAESYTYGTFVLSPIDNLCYVWIGTTPSLGGADPSVPNPLWVLIPAPAPQPFPPAYGSFSYNQIQLIPQASQLDLLFGQDFPPVGMTLAQPTPTGAVITNTGLYKIVGSLQCDRTSGGNSEIDFYPTINGVGAAGTASKLNINANEESVITVEVLLNVSAGQTVGWACYSTDADNRALAVVANPPVPAIPSIIMTIIRIA